jgi:hypothetical protein
MAYVSEWERLDDAANRIMATGLSKDETQTDICRAVSDRAVRIRAKLRKHTSRQLLASETVLEGKDFDIPIELKPEDLDWEKSRPVKPWFLRHGRSVQWGHWDLEWIELSGRDVSSILCAGGKKEGRAAQRASSKTSATSRSRPAFERARRAINDLYAQGVPDQAALPNASFCRRVGQKLNEESLPSVSDDTILRAAGRRN